MSVIFQTVLMHLALCGLAASLVLLTLRSRTVRETFARLLSIWRSLTAFGRVAVCSFFLIGVLVGGDKTNGVPQNISSPSPQIQQGGAPFQTGFTGLTGLSGVFSLVPLPQNSVNSVNSVYTASDDIARGWRVESVATNAAVSYAMPSNATLVGNWHRRGTFGEWMRLDLGGFAFPLGTNDTVYSSFSIFNDGKIRPVPRDVAHEICAVGVPMLAMQGESRFWVADDGDGAKLLAWENFFLNADTNTPVNAQIRLYSNGDFTTRSNEVATVCRRVNPHDWDGDGMHNERDANPTVCDGDFFGVANALPTNANPDAYYWIDISVTGVLGVASISITCDGPSDLGDHAIIARTNEVCHIPLLAGATYTVDSNLPIGYSAVSSEYAMIETNSATSLIVSLPLEFSLERIQTRGAMNAVNYGVSSSPINVFPSVASCSGGCCSLQVVDGAIRWVCPPTCTCGGADHLLEPTVLWEGYSKSFVGYAACGCGDDAPDPMPQYGPYAASVSVGFSKNAVIFEDAYENLPGEWVSRRSTATTLTIQANGGPNGGVLSVSSTNLSKLQKNSGTAFPVQSIAVPADHSVTYEMNYVGLSASDATNDVVVSATLTENGTGMTLHDSSGISVVEVRMLADVAAPSNSCTRRHVYGVHEAVNVEARPTRPEVSLSFGADAGFTNYDNDCFWCPWTGGVYSVSFIFGDAELPSSIKVFEPMPFAVEAWWNGIEGTKGTAGTVVMNVELLLAPFTVSFLGIWVVEIPDEAEDCPHFGYFDNPTYGRPWSHTTGAGAGEWFLVSQRNEWTHDRAGTSKVYPTPWTVGWKEWDIPIGWSNKMGEVKGRSKPNSVTERFEIDESGSVTIRKFGHWIKRAVNNRVWVDGRRVN